ncbi:MAG: bifunctional diaminohydroxyphosphoribosylaminopyrimidine deaminase/5-amino-6-(5-phosphoribosylamino)uracil reductase RibD [Pseudohongiellaceae bacterium]
MTSTNTGMTDADREAMQRALALASRVLTATPNPRVGCVLISDGELVGEGWHEQAGEPHAEANALSQAGTRARGATAYVTLEPCCVSGRTPPCTNALIDAGVAEVVYGMEDPNPAVSGSGLQALRDAGVRVRGPVFEEQARALNPGFIKRMQYGLPWLRCKVAMSLDGRTAMASGESQWITGPMARADVQLLRARSCAVLTGVNTVIADNPSLNVRAEQIDRPDAARLARRQPLRAVMDSSLRTPPDSRIIGLPGQVLFLVAGPHEHQLARFADNAAMIREAGGEAGGGRVAPQQALRLLADEFECNEVLLEAGPTLSGAMVQAGLVDEVVIYIGPRFLGSDAMPLLHLPGMQLMADQVALRIREMDRLGDDCRIVAAVESIAGSPLVGAGE